MLPDRFFAFLIVAVTCVTGTALHAYEVELTEVDSISVNYAVTQIEYAPTKGLLFLRERENKIHIVSTVTGAEIGVHFPTDRFYDMDLTQDSRYLFVADYGGVNIGYGTPINPHYVHRFDLNLHVWKIAEAPTVAAKIEAVSGTRVLLQELDQHVSMMLNSFGDSMTELSRISADYRGDIEFDPQTNRIYHGSSGSSSREIHVRRIAGDSLLYTSSTGTYGSAQDGGGTSVLATDGRFFYYGALQVEASEVTNNKHLYPEVIYAASDDIAFGQNGYYSADLGVQINSFGFSSTVYGVSESGMHVAALDGFGGNIRLYTITAPTAPRLLALVIEGPAGIGYWQSTQYRAIAIYTDGTRTDVTDASNWVLDLPIFGIMGSTGVMSSENRPGDFQISADFQDGNYVASDQRRVECIRGYGESGVEEIESFSLEMSVSQIEFDPAQNLLFLRSGESRVVIVDATTKQILESHEPTERFTDMDLTRDGQYLFIADNGGVNVGYGTPVNPHYVHRFHLPTHTWTIAEAPHVAWKIEGVSEDLVLLQERDQNVDMTLNSFGGTMTETSRIRADYYGDFEYDSLTQRVYHCSSGSSSREIHVRLVDGQTLIDGGNTGVYGSAQDGSGSCVLSSDGDYLYYGRLQVEAADIGNNLNYLPEIVYGAASEIAFGETRYYDAAAGTVLSGLAFPATVYGVSENGEHLWAYESDGNILHHYAITDPIENHVPMACISGDDQSVYTDAPSGANLPIRGTCSSDANSPVGTNDDIITFNWFTLVDPDDPNSRLFMGTGESLDVTLATGLHVIILIVVDRYDNIDETQVTITVIDQGDVDVNGDGQIDLNDYGLMPSCLQGPDVVDLPSECGPLDFDFGGTVDLRDAALLQIAFTGRE